MDELQHQLDAQAQRYERESDILLTLLEGVTTSETLHSDQVSLTLAQTKRVRRECTLLVQAAARLRDHHLQPLEAQGNE
jgi:hypothetical protein